MFFCRVTGVFGMMKILRDPLVLYLLLGGAVFGVYQLAPDGSGFTAAQPDEIVVSPGQINALAANFERTWGRPPTRQELDRLVQDYVRQEILYREALAMGLGENDTIIKRVLRQKLEFLVAGIAQPEPPGAGQLQAYLNANAEAYREQTVFSFRQVYLPREQRDRAAALLGQLRAGQVEPGELERLTLLPDSFDRQTGRAVERVMGREFVAELSATPAGNWQGPIESGYGYHLVHVTERTEGKIPELDAVRDAVSRDWLAQRRRELNEEYYQSLRDRYQVRIAEVPPAGAEQ